jgi:hypothetical protein
VNLASQRAVTSNDSGFDQVKLRFVKADDLHVGDLTVFLAEHLQAVRASASKTAAS